MSKKKEEKNSEFESVEYKEITFTCPTRGKVTERVKVKKYKAQIVEQKEFIRSSDPIINDFDVSEVIGLDDNDDTITGIKQ